MTTNSFNRALDVLIDDKFEDFKAAIIGNPDLLRETDASGQTLVHIAARHGRVKALDALKTAGADLNQPDKYGKTPVHIAAENNDVGALEFFVRAGAILDKQVKTLLKTPVYIAAEKGHLDALGVLAKAGADLNIRDRSGNTPAGIAEKMGRTAVIAYIQQWQRGRDASITVEAARIATEATAVPLAAGEAAVPLAATTGAAAVGVATDAATGAGAAHLTEGRSDGAMASTQGAGPRIALKNQLLGLLGPLENKIRGGGRLAAYTAAAEEIDGIIKKLTSAINEYCGVPPSKKSSDKFRGQCIALLSDANTRELRQHRDTLGYVFVAFKNFFTALGKIITRDTGDIRLIDDRTDTAKRIDDLKRELQGIIKGDEDAPSEKKSTPSSGL